MLKTCCAIFVGIVLFISCGQNAIQTENANSRPHDPWVFRSVLDSMPRMLTVALDENMWAAYSTQKCALYKVWKGYVSLEGAVYNTHHGPQPLSMGDAFFVNKNDSPWQVLSGGQNVLKATHYAGHQLAEGKVKLHYQLELNDGKKVSVLEQPEYTESESGQRGFERIFSVQNLPPGHQVVFASNVGSVASRSNIKTNGELSFDNESKSTFDNKEVLDLVTKLTLNTEGETTFTTFFVSKPTVRNPRKQSEEEEDLPLGYRLIAQNDCKTCHNTNVKTIGPAYTDIAEKYPTSEENVRSLASKIIKGGAGIWGIQVMSPHPELAITDAEEMVRYILALDLDDEGATMSEAGEIPTSDFREGENIEGLTLIPGAAVRIFSIPPGTSKVPAISAARKPIMGGVMPAFANINGGEFKELTDDFALYADGYLEIPEDDTYTLRLWSDDGSNLYLGEELVIDNDGSHGTESKDVTVGLKKGFHPFRIEFFQGGGGKFLSLNWKSSKMSSFATVPTFAFYHSSEQQKAVSGYELPMSIMTKTPGDGYPVPGVHPSYDLSQARPYDFLPKVGGMDFLPDGRLVVCTWDPSGGVYIIENADSGDPSTMSYKRIAAGLAEPLGLKVVDGDIYVLQKQELTRLVDTDGDDMIDDFQLVSNDWRTSANFHEFAFGLEYQDGYFYAALATAINPGGASTNPQIPDRGKVIKVNKNTGEVDFIAHGLRTPNGIGKGIDGEIFLCDNQGDWLPSSKLVHVREGAFFGSRSVDFEGTAGLKETPPVLWLPQDEIGNSPGTPLVINDGAYKGQMIHGEVTHGGVKRDFIEKVNGEYQGAVFRFIQGLEAGVNRMVWGPDGSLYVGGIGNPGNWQTSGTLWYGLQRLKYNGYSTFEMLAVRAKSNGVEIEFTEPLKQGDGWVKSDYEIRQWKYVPTIEYGGPKVDDKPLNIRSVNVSKDRKKVFLELDGMKAGHVVYVHLLNSFVSAENHGLWATEAWYTMNAIPQNNPGTKTGPAPNIQANSLTSEQQADGWKLLFDGKTTNGWTNFNKETIGASWKVANGELYLDSQQKDDGGWQAADGGDIVCADNYENFEFELEWKIANCGNSGIMFSVVETDKFDHPWQTGPEMQILDNVCHPDARFPTHRAGDLYDMIECKYVTVKPAGAWNKIRIVKKDGKVEQWQNGKKVVEYEMYTDKWNRMIAKSKFKEMEGFGLAKSGKIALQDHGDKVWFRNIKIREL